MFSLSLSRSLFFFSSFFLFLSHFLSIYLSLSLSLSLPFVSLNILHFPSHGPHRVSPAPHDNTRQALEEAFHGREAKTELNYRGETFCYALPRLSSTGYNVERT